MATARDIPQCNPKAGYLEHAEAIDAAIRGVLQGGRYILGPEVSVFEREFAAFVGTAHCAGVANGTAALEIALRALDIGGGDRVVTVSNSAVATTVAIRATGATPLFVDVDAEHGLMDVGHADELLSRAARGEFRGVNPERIKAILPVHLYGRCVDMNALAALARRFRLPIVEDCAQAHGATFQGRAAGAQGALGCFSFYPTKNLGAIGDAGAIVTGSPELDEKIRLLREYGWRERYVSSIEGGNSRLDELQAAVLRVKLGALAQDNAKRRAIAAVYRARIRNPAITMTTARDDGDVYHQFVVRAPHRDALQRYLRECGIGALVHYPRAIHQQPAYADVAFRPLPLVRTEQWAARVLSLPMFPQLPIADAELVADRLNGWKPPG